MLSVLQVQPILPGWRHSNEAAPCQIKGEQPSGLVSRVAHAGVPAPVTNRPKRTAVSGRVQGVGTSFMITCLHTSLFKGLLTGGIDFAVVDFLAFAIQACLVPWAGLAFVTHLLAVVLRDCETNQWSGIKCSQIIESAARWWHQKHRYDSLMLKAVATYHSYHCKLG